MKRNVVTGALCALITVATGCTEDVGDCYDGGTRGLDTVINGSHVEYGGQAIMNRACATDCHNSTASGKKRHGAPAGLDFDLTPINAANAESAENENGRTYAVLNEAEINGLRERQRKIFSERNRIWQQVRDGLMPPDGLYEGWKAFVASLVDTDETAPCTRGTNLPDIDAKKSQDVLRLWLACQAPIVEAYGGPVEVNGTAGQAGYQYLACSGSVNPGDGGAGDGGGPTASVGFDQLYMDVFGTSGSGSCAVCHPGAGGDVVDLTSEAKAFADLVEDKAAKCDGKPYVTPGDPDKSYLYDLVSKDDPCPDRKVDRMPLGTPLADDAIEEIRAWIEGGALRTAARISPPINGGLDAGVR